MTSPTDGFLRRLDGVEQRLSVHARRDFPDDALTAPDQPAGERWEVGQVWAHVAEFIPYWLAETALVIERGIQRPEPFGRTKSDPGRMAAIERDRATDRARLWHRSARDIASLRVFLSNLDESAWGATGIHPTLGEMTLSQIMDEFLVGHLEQHAAQLDQLAG